MSFPFLLLAAVAALPGSPRLNFTKSFPGSVPAYVSVTVDRSGVLEYKEATGDDHPILATLGASDTAALFDLAEKLEHFHIPLESGLKVANTGKKTFRYVDEDGKASEAVFNYSLLPSAAALLDKFEQIAQTERAFLDLDRTARYDHLGVNDSLAAIESLWLRKQLAAPEQFVPLLTRISKHEAYMHLVRDRAARLCEQFASASAAPPTAAVSPPSAVTP